MKSAIGKEYAEAKRLIAEARMLNQEAHVLLGLIAAEFCSDPLSVQCFDLRIVERVKQAVAARAEWERRCRHVDTGMLELARTDLD
jgi:hypothetical protein